MSEFLHGKELPNRLGLYRFLLGIILFFETLSQLPFTRELYSDQGFHLGFFSELAPPLWLAWTLVITLLIANLGMIFGSGSRAVISVILLLRTFLYSLDQINEKTASTLAIVVLAILVYAPSHNKFSLFKSNMTDDQLHCVFPLRLLQFQFVQVYFFSAVVKITQPDWPSGAVLYRAFSSRWATEFGYWVGANLPYILFRAAGIGTVIFEILAPFLLFWEKGRKYVITIGVLFHVGTSLTLYVGALSAHFVIALLVLFPSDAYLNEVSNWIRSTAQKLQKSLHL